MFESDTKELTIDALTNHQQKCEKKDRNHCSVLPRLRSKQTQRVTK